MRVMYVDTETPGFKKPLEAIEVGGCYCDSVLVNGAVTGHFVERYKPKLPIEWGAMAVHHILPEELEDKPAWNATKFAAERLRGLSYVVGHNIDFDMEVLGIAGTKSIDTLALARYWEPDLDSHKLGALMYHMFGANEDTREELRGAHSALADITMTVRWLWSAVEIYTDLKGQKIMNWNELWKLSEVGRIPFRMTFGKYGPQDGERGLRIKDMKSKDPGYVSWLRKNCSDNKYLMKALDNPR